MTLNATHFSISSFLDSPMHIVRRWLYGVRHCLLEGRYSWILRNIQINSYVYVSLNIFMHSEKYLIIKQERRKMLIFAPWSFRIRYGIYRRKGKYHRGTELWRLGQKTQSRHIGVLQVFDRFCFRIRRRILRAWASWPVWHGKHGQQDVWPVSYTHLTLPTTA